MMSLLTELLEIVCSRSTKMLRLWRWRLLHQRLKLAMVDLAGAGLRNILHHLDLARDAEIRQPLRLDGVADFVQGPLAASKHGEDLRPAGQLPAACAGAKAKEK